MICWSGLLIYIVLLGIQIDVLLSIQQSQMKLNEAQSQLNQEQVEFNKNVIEKFKTL